MVVYPPWLEKCIYWTSIVHDLAIILMGVFAVQESPRTILLALPDSYNFVWAALLVIGGVLSLVGVYTSNVRLETTGCAVVIGAKLVWVVAAFTPQIELFGTETLAMALLAGASGTLWRVFGLFIGQYLRSGE